jgi:hypothetical protein
VEYQHSFREKNIYSLYSKFPMTPTVGASIGDRTMEQNSKQPVRRWACALVHSRTFATAAQDGGVGVRVMVPVLDMFNHAGDEVRNLLSSRSSACDNCRWLAVAPENNPAGEWVMQVRVSYTNYKTYKE